MIITAPYIFQESSAINSALAALFTAVRIGDQAFRRAAIGRLEAAMAAEPQVEQPLEHEFAPGLYLRRIVNPKGSLVATKIHREPNVSTLLRGKMSIITEDGMTMLNAPAQFITKPGTKRIIYAQEECEFTTIHPNPLDTRDIDALERRIIAPDFSSLEAV